MKKTFSFVLPAAVLLLAFGLAFAGCKNDSSDGTGLTPGDGTLTQNADGTTTVPGSSTPVSDADLAAAGLTKGTDHTTNMGVKITVKADGSIEVILPEPKATELYPYTDPDFLGSPGITVTPSDLKGTMIGKIYINQSKSLMLATADQATQAIFYYADKDGEIKGTYSGDGETATVAITLKKGWNTVLVTEAETEDEYSFTAVSGTPDSSYKWQIIDRGDYDAVPAAVDSGQ